MSYEPTNWKSGDTVTSAKLNKIEQGIANSSSNSSGNIEIITGVVSDDIITLEKTADEILQYAESGKLVFLKAIVSGASIFGFLSTFYANMSGFGFYFLTNNGPFAETLSFMASTSSDYPTGGFSSGDNSGDDDK